MARVSTRVGDIFSVKIDDNSKKYFQYIISDLTQLNSDVIRTFIKVFPIRSNPDLSEVIKGEVDFYAHCVTKWGVKLGFWEKVGNINPVGEHEVIFRCSEDDGHPEIIVSDNWWVWKINEEQKRVGKLDGKNREAEIGSVVPPNSIVYRMKYGEYDFKYPEFE